MSPEHKVTIYYCHICGYKDEAAELAKEIEQQLGISAVVESGTWGQFDILLDDELVATKNGEQGRLGKFLSLGDFPEPERTIAALKERLEQADAS